MRHFLYEVYMKKEHLTLLSSTFLFDGLSESVCEELLRTIHIDEASFSKGDVIYSPDEFEKKIGFVLDGECIISKPSAGQQIPINIVKKGDSFGIISVFSTHSVFPTFIIAKSLCSVLFINYYDIHRLIEKNHQLSLNIINFLAERISFLNDRIAAFSGTTVENKLVNYIIGQCKKYDSLEFEFNKKHSAEAISCGRASLYRAMDALVCAGLVKFDAKKIYIIDRKGLERMSK